MGSRKLHAPAQRVTTLWRRPSSGIGIRLALRRGNCLKQAPDGAVSRALHLSILRRHGACPACEAPQRRTNLISPPLFWKSTISCSPCTGWIIQFQPASSSKSDKPLAITRGPSRIERKTPSAPIMSCQVGSIHSTERHFRSSALGFSSTHRRSSRRVCGDAFTGHLTSCSISFESSMSSLQVLGLRTSRPVGRWRTSRAR